jgi:hypothetical protein
MQCIRDKDMLAVKGDDSAISLLLNIGAAQGGRSMLFSGEQKLLFEGWKKGLL